MSFPFKIGDRVRHRMRGWPAKVVAIECMVCGLAECTHTAGWFITLDTPQGTTRPWQRPEYFRHASPDRRRGNA